MEEEEEGVMQLNWDDFDMVDVDDAADSALGKRRRSPGRGGGGGGSGSSGGGVGHRGPLLPPPKGTRTAWEYEITNDIGRSRYYIIFRKSFMTEFDVCGRPFEENIWLELDLASEAGPYGSGRRFQLTMMGNDRARLYLGKHICASLRLKKVRQRIALCASSLL